MIGRQTTSACTYSSRTPQEFCHLSYNALEGAVRTLLSQRVSR